MIEVDEWAEIRRLHRGEGMGIKAIARKLGVARNTVRAALRSDDAPRYTREGPGSAVDAFEPAIRRLLATTPVNGHAGHSQLPVDSWHAVMADPTLAEAPLDRILPASHRMAMKGPSNAPAPTRRARR